MTGTGSLRGSSFRLPCKRTTASSRLTSLRPPSPSHHPRSPFLLCFSFSFSFSLFLSLFLLLFPSSTLRFASLFGPVRAFALASLSSLVRPTGQPAVNLSLFLPSSSSTMSPLLFRTKALPHARNGPPSLHSCAASLRCANTTLLSFSLARSLVHRSATCVQLVTRFVSSPQCPLFSSFSPRKAEVMPRIRFFILPPPLLPWLHHRRCPLLLCISFVVRSMIGPTILMGHATIYPTRRRGQFTMWVGRTRPEDERR